ncbi:MAG: bacillithiol biosynthesis deacetylase BshB1 [Bacteroidia bacterium]|nr:bacillithiol biosynthesis deacetylase BshB1 [Bacteroidia bacterium]MDW8235627.1 bacillithiol biosynthesis deacetylase BshB1 [Bacteroidia bacterium]
MQVIMTLMAHPDDAELSCGGSLLRWREEGATIVMVELTAGQLGTRGTPALRYQEAQTAARFLRPVARVCLGWEDGFFEETKQTLLTLIEVIRQYRPLILITNALRDRHPDHGRAARLVERAAFLSGLRKISTAYPPYRPPFLWFAIQDWWQMPSFVVDITPYWQGKLALIHAYQSQFFYQPGGQDPPSYLTRADFFPHLEARAREMGHFIGATYGEGFITRQPIPLSSFRQLIHVH